MYKKALQMKLRVSSKFGELSVERLFDLKLSDLKEILIDLDSKLKNSSTDSLDFLEEDSTVGDTEDKVRFEVVKDIYLTKVSEKTSVAEERKAREADKTIREIIARKKHEDLESKSIEELEAMLSKKGNS